MSEIRPLVNVLTQFVERDELSEEALQTATWETDGKLDRLCAEAWKNLQWWLNDEDIRLKDHEYGSAKKKKLQWLLVEIAEEAQRRKIPTE